MRFTYVAGSTGGTGSSGSGEGGAVGLDVALTATAVALLGVCGARSFAGRRLVASLETVEASALAVRAVLGQVSN